MLSSNGKKLILTFLVHSGSLFSQISLHFFVSGYCGHSSISIKSPLSLLCMGTVEAQALSRVLAFKPEVGQNNGMFSLLPGILPY